ncbi:glycosyltransferase [Loigolactobacillus coryniformis]|uniref:glycosyltransferase n=1 Tax=Loigolactobacillus coryniformis TaxID=1610 RepID=UPI00201AC9B8|nr:glycosyltransferase [Loigolactobacillus coryniformis]MCL5457658.1 glycosyltransferase [Loigolactobacillus coryniformis]
MVKNKFKYASVIVTFNRSELLIQAIDSLLEQTVPPSKIIVINNASTDNTIEVLTKKYSLLHSIVQIVTLAENKGGSYGFYKGLSIAQQLDVDWISVSDDDAIYEKEFFKNIRVAVLEQPDVEIFTGTVMLENKKIQLNHRRRVVNSKTLKQVEVSEIEYKNNFWIDTFTFVGVVFNVRLIRKIGLPQKDYFIWFDDTEYALRAKEYSRALNVSNAVVIHKTQPAALNGGFAPNWREYYGIRNEIITNLKHTTSRPIQYIYIYYQFIKKILGILMHRDVAGYRVFQLKLRVAGTLDGLRDITGKNTRYYPGMNYRKR